MKKLFTFLILAWTVTGRAQFGTTPFNYTNAPGAADLVLGLHQDNLGRWSYWNYPSSALGSGGGTNASAASSFDDVLNHAPTAYKFWTGGSTLNNLGGFGGGAPAGFFDGTNHWVFTYVSVGATFLTVQCAVGPTLDTLTNLGTVLNTNAGQWDAKEVAGLTPLVPLPPATNIFSYNGQAYSPADTAGCVGIAFGASGSTSLSKYSGNPVLNRTNYLYNGNPILGFYHSQPFMWNGQLFMAVNFQGSDGVEHITVAVCQNATNALSAWFCFTNSSGIIPVLTTGLGGYDSQVQANPCVVSNANYLEMFFTGVGYGGVNNAGLAFSTNPTNGWQDLGQIYFSNGSTHPFIEPSNNVWWALSDNNGSVCYYSRPAAIDASLSLMLTNGIPLGVTHNYVIGPAGTPGDGNAHYILSDNRTVELSLVYNGFGSATLFEDATQLGIVSEGSRPVRFYNGGSYTMSGITQYAQEDANGISILNGGTMNLQNLLTAPGAIGNYSRFWESNNDIWITTSAKTNLVIAAH